MFKRMHALPKIRMHYLMQGNPPAWCLQWPTLTSNPSTPMFFEEPAGAGRCVKLTIATPLTTQRTMKGSQAPPFTASSKARIMHVLLDPRLHFALALILTPRDRYVLDEQPVEPWADHVGPLYNDRSFCPEAQPLLFNGVGRGDVDIVDPSKLYHERTGDMLKSKFSELRSACTRALDNFQLSCQNEADSFPCFTNGNMAVMYLHCIVQTEEGSRLRDFSSRLMPEDAQREEGISSAEVESAVRGTLPQTAAEPRRESARGSYPQATRQR
jgi:hypothetical protein